MYLLCFHLWVHVSSLPFSLIHHCLCGCDCLAGWSSWNLWPVPLRQSQVQGPSGDGSSPTAPLHGLAGVCARVACWSVSSLFLFLTHPHPHTWLYILMCLCYQPKIESYIFIKTYVVGLANWTWFVYIIYLIEGSPACLSCMSDNFKPVLMQCMVTRV